MYFTYLCTEQRHSRFCKFDMRKGKRNFLVVMGLIMLGTVYFTFNPTQSFLFPKCPFLLVTELKCPGCGSQRAIHALLHLRFIEAIKCNALFVFSLPYIFFLTYAEIKRKSNPNLYLKANHITLIYIYLFLVLGWWISRNIFGW